MACWAEFAGKVLGNPEKAQALGEQAMIEARRGAVIRCPVWVWIAQKSFPAMKPSNGNANDVRHGPMVTANGMRVANPPDRPTAAERTVHIAGTDQPQNLADRNGHANGFIDPSNGPTEDDVFCDVQVAKKPSFLLRTKMYRSLQRLRSG